MLYCGSHSGLLVCPRCQHFARDSLVVWTIIPTLNDLQYGAAGRSSWHSQQELRTTRTLKLKLSHGSTSLSWLLDRWIPITAIGKDMTRSLPGQRSSLFPACANSKSVQDAYKRKLVASWRRGWLAPLPVLVSHTELWFTRARVKVCPIGLWRSCLSTAAAFTRFRSHSCSLLFALRTATSFSL